MCLLLAPVLWDWNWRTVLTGPRCLVTLESAEVGNEVEWGFECRFECRSQSRGSSSEATAFLFLISALAHQIFALNICWALCRLRLGTEGDASVIPEYVQPEFWLVCWGRETCNKCWGGQFLLNGGRKTLHYFWSPATDSACVWMWRPTWDAEFSFLGMFRAT